MIVISGAKDRKLTNMLRLATRSFSKNLFNPQMIRHLEIRITIIDDLDAGGYCNYADDKYPPRKFLIDIFRTREKIHMITALAHEMVHVKQLAKGEMKDKQVKSKYYTSWRGETFSNDILYWDQPWEIEAYGLQESLVAKFLIEHNQFKNLRQKQKDWFVYD